MGGLKTPGGKNRLARSMSLLTVTALEEEQKLLPDAEILLLKTHLLVERILTAAVGERLWSEDENLPRLAFSVLIDLGSGDEGREKFVWLNDLRNALAHEFSPFDSAEFAQMIGRFGARWPGHGAARRRVIGAVCEYMLSLAWRELLFRMFNARLLVHDFEAEAAAEPIRQYVDYCERVLSQAESLQGFDGTEGV